MAGGGRPTSVEAEPPPGRGAGFRAVWARLDGWHLALGLVLVGTLVRLPQLDNSLAEAFAFRQTQTAFVAREYVEGGVDVLQTPLPVLGADADVPFEMPLYQAAVAVIDQLGIDDVAVSARLLGLVSFQAAALLLYTLVRRWHGVLAGVVTLMLFQFTPFSLQWGAAALIDFPAVALALGMVVGLDSWFARASRWGLVLGSVSAVLSYLVKTTTPPTWGFLLLASSAVTIRELGWGAAWRRQLVGYASGPALGVVAALAWTRHADAVKGSQPLTGFLLSGELNDWNFGTLGQRTNLGAVGTITERVHDSIAGAGLALVVVALALLCTRAGGRQLVRYGGWILTALGAPLVFFNLYLVHDYYLIAVYPAITAVVGIAIALVVSACWTAPRWRWVVGLAGGVAVLVTSALTLLGRQSIDNYARSNAPPDLAVAMAEASDPGDHWILVGCDWDPVYLFYADRKGVMFREDDSQGFWDVEDPATYPRLAVCSDVPSLEPYLPPGAEALPLGAEALPLDGPEAIYEVVPAA